MRCISLFSGCGGLDLGLSQAGFKIIFAADNEVLCTKSHNANFKDGICHHLPVENITRDILESSLGDISNGNIDLLVGGPPCPPYSKSRFYRTEKPRGLDDPLGKLTMNGYLQLLQLVNPKAFILENVHGLAYKVHSEAFSYIYDVATSLKYNVFHAVLNAADYGVPQIRKRLFIVGVKTKKFEFPNATHSELVSNHPHTEIKPWVTAGEAIGSLETSLVKDIPGHFAGGKHHELLEDIPPGDNYLFYTKERGCKNPIFKWRSRYWSFLLKLSPEKPSWTIQARRSNNMGPLHWMNRILTVEEVKRLQSFPDNWQLEGSIENQWRQIGNAVPPLLAFHLGKSIMKAIS